MPCICYELLRFSDATLYVAPTRRWILFPVGLEVQPKIEKLNTVVPHSDGTIRVAYDNSVNA